ncbi:hypothetical protein GCM10010994_32720 [Chelatococcus reniformis]|uniref:HD domain-containing protein n=2 Tax=Chelatococcus reniformis TaxID=1494448 RepID=A0A916XH61_9HYPH|nr:hypothetical protein GCM10010994_32720 [Chelatococcus reniformis]
MRDPEHPSQCSGPPISDADWSGPALAAQVLHAATFAASRHAGQAGKGRPPRPYINHLLEVAELVATAGGGDDPALLSAALLHDVIEKAGVTAAALRAAFGDDVTRLVEELTDDPRLSDDEQKQAQIDHAPTLTRRAKLIKLADKTSNLRAQATEPPAHWPPARRAAHLVWARAVARGCRGVSPALDQAFDAAAAAFEVGAGWPGPAGGTASPDPSAAADASPGAALRSGAIGFVPRQQP